MALYGLIRSEFNHTVKSLQRYRSSRSQMFLKIGVPKILANFTGKHLCWSLFLNKVAGLRPESSLKKRLQHRCFLVKVVKILKDNTFFTEYL